jgi:hypothetical protein
MPRSLKLFHLYPPHNLGNPYWKSFKILWDLRRKKNYDFFIVNDLVEERLGRKVGYDCEVLMDPKELKRRRLRSTGVDFWEPGKRELDIC